MENAEPIPVGGIKDWAKGQVKNILLSYLKPYWEEAKTAIETRDWNKIADIIDKGAALAGYIEVGKAFSEIFRAIAAGDYVGAFEKGIAAAKLIYALFPKPASKPSGPNITVSASADPAEHEINDLVDCMFSAPAPTLTASADEVQLDADGKPAKFGFMEIAAILSIGWTISQWVRQRRQDKQNSGA